MHPLLVPFLASCGLLALAGLSKLRTPAGTAQALRTQGLPSSTGLVRALGAAEVALAAAAVAQVPGAAALVALAYAAFTGFVLLALLRDRPLSSCGCFGQPDLPPTWAHVAVTGAAAVGAVAVAVGGDAGLPALGDAGPGTAVAALLSAGLVGWLAHQVLAGLPLLLAARTAPASSPSLRSATP